MNILRINGRGNLWDFRLHNDYVITIGTINGDCTIYDYTSIPIN